MHIQSSYKIVYCHVSIRAFQMLYERFELFKSRSRTAFVNLVALKIILSFSKYVLYINNTVII